MALFPLWRAPRTGAAILGPIIMVLGGISALVLLLACANLASLLLARGVNRRREIAIRLSLGARRSDVARQLLVESLLLALLGGVAGLFVASFGIGLLEAWAPPTPFPLSIGAEIDGGAIAVAAGVALLTALLFGLVPALQAARPGTADTLREEATSVTGGRARLRHGLVVAQVALSVMLLVAAGLFLRTLQRMQSTDLGFDPSGVQVTSLELFTSGYDRERGFAFYRELLERASGMPGVEQASLVRRVPLGFGGSSSTSFEVDGYVAAKDAENWANFNTVGPGYFSLMRNEIVDGREITAEDREDAPAVAVVNETMAARYWQGREAVGGRFRLGETWITVVGVAQEHRLPRSRGEAGAVVLPAALPELPAGHDAAAAHRRRPRGARGAGESARSRSSTPASPRTRSRRSGPSSAPPTSASASAASCWACSASSACCSRRSGSTACCRSRWRAARARSGSGWLSAARAAR